MTIGSHLTTFAGHPVRDFEPGGGWDAATGEIPRLRVDYDSETTSVDLFRELLQTSQADDLQGLVLGAWASEMYEASPAENVEALVAAADQLPNLKAIFLGDITYEENEISWIQQTDISAIWDAFPRLEAFGVRGSNGLSLGNLRHNHLKQLVIQCGGLPRTVLAELSRASLPALESLELYLGDSGYGWDGAVDDLAPILSGKLFPRLKHLGLCDSEIADDVAKAVAASPILAQLESLDLSLGTLGDEGAKALLAAPGIKKLKRLNLAHHYLSDEVSAELQQLGIEVDLSDPQGDDDERYVAVGE